MVSANPGTSHAWRAYGPSSQQLSISPVQLSISSPSAIESSHCCGITETVSADGACWNAGPPCLGGGLWAVTIECNKLPRGRRSSGQARELPVRRGGPLRSAASPGAKVGGCLCVDEIHKQDPSQNNSGPFVAAHYFSVADHVPTWG